VTGPLHLRFDRGTLRIDGPAADSLPAVVWDDRVIAWRAPAHRYVAILDHAASSGLALIDEIAPRLRTAPGPWIAPSLRPYQRDALHAWRAFRSRGLVALPTGSGKTIVAVAALASAAAPGLILCPTRALLEQWERELERFYAGPVGVVGDGARRIEAVTVMTFESAYRQLDIVGDRFAVLVVDEAHHFAGGFRAEALEMCVAPKRLGLTATAPDPGSAAARCLEDLIGPLVCEVGVGELLGVHLADLEVLRMAVRLEPDELAAYVRDYRPFAELRGAFARANPDADWASTLRAIARTAAGRAAISNHRRAVALASFPKAKRSLLAALLTRHREDKSLIFTSSTDDAYAIALEHLVPVITADTGRSERLDILDRYRDGRYRTLVSACVLNEGVNVPDARIAIIVAGRFGRLEQVQRIGRVLRPAPGKVARVYELVTSETVDDGRARARGGRLVARSASRV
jgi:superfamily II DNA or RNA helicase